MVDISREGGSASYNDACSGRANGVDLFGSSMNYFMGCKVLPELLTMQKVGIYVDMPPLLGESLNDNKGLRPYIYLFRVEDIRCWILDKNSEPNEFAAILLQERCECYDENTGFPIGLEERYRHLWKDGDGQVMAAFYNEGGQMIDQFGQPMSEAIPLEMNKIPFIVLDIGESLMTDVADYQVALLNLASTDMSYVIKSNFPFYTEQVNQRAENLNIRTGQPGTPGQTPGDAKAKDVVVGVAQGRQYPEGMERPGFINPSPEPLMASMKKQEQLKEEIRLLLKLNIMNLSPPQMASAESKSKDTRSLENGLSYIGLCLENAERKIAEYWSMYDDSKQATVNYPVDYSLHSEEERRTEAEYLEDIKTNVNSPTMHRIIQKRLAKISMGTKVSNQTMVKIEAEIDQSQTLVTDPEILLSLNEAGICSGEDISETLGFPKGDFEKAQKEHTERLDRIAQSQLKVSAARGLPDASSGPDAKNEKVVSQKRDSAPTNKPRTRGEA